MRLIGFILFIILQAGQANAQQSYFIYLQSDAQQPFFARIGKEVYSSSAVGFAIIPHLKDSVYQLAIGFPNNQWPEYVFNCVINKKDKGFVIKNFGEKGWGLFNLQTADVIMGLKVEKQPEQKTTSRYPLTSDAFTVMLASAVDDPDLRQTQLIVRDNVSEAVVRQEIKKPVAEEKKIDDVVKSDAGKSEQKNVALQTKPTVGVVIAGSATSKQDSKKIILEDKSNAKKSDSAKPHSDGAVQQSVALEDKPKAEPDKTIGIPIKPDSVVTKTLLFTKISRTLQFQNREGMEMIYVDDQLNGTKDTIRIFIPSEQQAELTSTSQGAKQVSGNKAVSTEKKDPQFLDMAVAPRKDEVVKQNDHAKSQAADMHTSVPDSVKKHEAIVDTVATAKSGAVVKSPNNCKKLATDKDVSSLKNKMVVMRDEDDMVNLALKSFKQKCFTADKIRSLCFVFITDQGKYKLMDAAYPFVYDPENFSSLANLLTDTYYMNRFRSLVKND